MKKVFLIFVGLFLITFSLSFAAQKADHSSEKVEVSDINTEHLVHTKILYDEIYDIDISEGHYRTSVEVLLAWEDPNAEIVAEYTEKDRQFFEAERKAENSG